VDWEIRLMPYRQLIEELKVKFNNISVQHELIHKTSPISALEARVKTVPSIMAKAERKGFDLDEVESKMEDIAGIRIICRFVDDIPTIVDIITKREDMRIVQHRDYITRKKESGYRSYHLIVQYALFGPDGLRSDIFCEIQIRTKAMDFWAVLEHNLRYKYRQNIPADIAKRLTHAAEAAFNLDADMSIIREQILAAEISNRDMGDALFEARNIMDELAAMGYDDIAENLRNSLTAAVGEGNNERVMEILLDSRGAAAALGIRN